MIQSLAMDYISRRAFELIQSRLRVEPVVALQGPRTVGKSTLLGEVARGHGVEVVDLDEPVMRSAVTADPAIFMAGASPVCVDEFQKAPVVLDSIKAELNRSLTPGRFVITGSTRFDALPRAAQALTGRIHVIDLLPLSQGEIDGATEGFLEVAMTDPERLTSPHRSTTTRSDYIERICRGGLPLAVSREGTIRNRWFDDYVRVSLARDVLELAKIRQGALLPALLKRLAGQTAQLLNMAAAGRAAGLEPRTAETYTKLLEDLFLVRRLGAWGRTLRSRSGSAPKIHVLDSGLAARLIRLTPAKMARLDPAAMSDFGHLLETFVVGEILKQASWSSKVADVGHWRTRDGHEVDLVIEHYDGTVTAFEVKSAARITGKDTRGLQILRKALGDTFNAGFVLNTGELAYRFDERIFVAPIDLLWSNRS
ncbi:MAG: ATP-binding protein [Acidimicrobiaceae bacterium]|nr:ATP-binding protein [Acidimicrobiaceae bacterium]MXW77080.1 ATP-binding protein [Acidimicrobiaceae bacterium]MYA74417.1 ATP-binding protein [Acidimicrobiaceae bacterium]MYC43444.1 ATP-binding protein [Acidimicrobiaceae bacterium]MYD05743.1 ATP-binding protein [Acidimicrobiaceae bacterium]